MPEQTEDSEPHPSGVLTLDVTIEGNAAVFFTVEPVK